jgi:Rps23 Pro-64 3,4-dihydroxylase Tpa1-like proline 4-hydroxylase
MLNISRIQETQLESVPYSWAVIDRLYSPKNAQELAATYPRDHFKTMIGYDDEKEWKYEVRSLTAMGADSPAFGEHLSPAWRQLAADLVSLEYRCAVSQLTGLDLLTAPIEANVFHYGAGSWQGPHKDLPAKRVTHVLYFNEQWREQDGGHLRILHSQEMNDVFTRVSPEIGNSAIFVRSNHSWHAVEPVVAGCTRTRRSVTVTFYHEGAVSTMWPPGEIPELHDYPAETPIPVNTAGWKRWLRWVGMK